MLIVHGLAEHCERYVCLAAELTAVAPKRVVQSRCFDGLAHEIFNEPERDFIVGALIDFLRNLSVPAR